MATEIPSDFIIPGTFVTIEGTGTSTSETTIALLMAETSALTTGSGVTFNISSTDAITYKPSTLLLDAAGTGYAVNDTITVNNVGIATVTKVGTSGAISTISTELYTTALVSDMAATGISGTGGTGSGATFTATSTEINTYTVEAITVDAAGTGYHLGDVFNVGTYGTVTVSSINANGGVTGITTVLSTVGYTTDPQATGVSPTTTDTITGPTNTATYASSLADLQSTFGTDADICRMYERYASVDSSTEVYVITTASSSAADITAALATVEEFAFTQLVSPFSDSDQIEAIHTFLDARWQYNSGLYAIHITARTDTIANLITYGATVNDQYSTVVGFAPGSTDDDVVKAAAVGAVIIPSLASDPSLPLQLMEIDVATSGNGFTVSQRNALFNAGVAITKETTAGVVYLERSRTTYQTNSAGTADNTYQNTETLPTVALCANRFRDNCNTVFFDNQMKLSATDTTSSISGRNIATPASIKAELITTYSTLVSDGYCQDTDTFNKNVSVTIPSTGVVAVYCPITLINQLRQIQINIDFSI